MLSPSEIEDMYHATLLELALQRRKYGWIGVGIFVASDAWSYHNDPSAAMVCIGLALALVTGAFIAVKWPTPLYFLGDAFFLAIVTVYLAAITLAGINHWSNWFPLDWIMIAVFAYGARRSLSKYQELAKGPGSQAGKALAAITCLIGLALVAADWFLPDHYSRHLHEGRRYASNKEFVRAVDEFSMAIAAAPRRYEGYHNRGLAKKQVEDYRGAQEDFTEAIARRRDFAPAHFNRAACRQRLGDVDGAIADYTRVVELDPKMAEAFGFRGLLYLARGQPEQAHKDLDECFRIRPEKRKQWEVLIQKATSHPRPAPEADKLK